jgi:hypothetical protein
MSPATPPAPPQPPKRKGWLRFGVLIGILWIAGCGAIINAIGGGENSANTAAQPTPSATIPAAIEDTTTVPEPEPDPTQETARIGEKIRDDDYDYEFVVSKITCGISRVGSDYFGDKAQGQFCLVKLRVKNVGDEPILYSEENQALVDRKGKTYSADDEAWIHVDSDPFGEINRGNTLKTTVPFDIPKRVKPDYLLLKAGVWGFSEGVRVEL